jgi:Protein of unknown function (DUF429)
MRHQAQSTSEHATRVLGLDWSGARKAAAKIWACILEQRSGESRSTVVYLNRPLDVHTPRSAVPDAMAIWLGKQDFSLAGFDFCFGLHHKHAMNFCSPQSGRHRPPSLYGACLQVITAEQFRLQAAQEMRRNTARIVKAPFAPTNLRMYKQTYLGLLLIAALGKNQYSFLPWGAVDRDRRLVIEVLPANIQRWLDPNRKSYKGRSLSAKNQRAFLLSSLERNADIHLVQQSMRDQIIRDREGDALDAVFAAVSAQRAKNAGFVIEKEHYVDAMLEGWIF